MEKNYKKRKFILLVHLIIRLLFTKPSNNTSCINQQIGVQIVKINVKNKGIQAPSIEISEMDPYLDLFRQN